MSEMTVEEFWTILHDVPPPNSIFYRLYYDDNGCPLFYSMEDLPGNYINIDEKTFTTTPSNIRVVDGEIKVLKAATVLKLVPSNEGITCHPLDVSIVVDPARSNIKWSLK